MLAPGARIGAYEVVGELGRGGMGVVLRVRRADLQRDFALKVILPGKDTTPEVLERFRREARAAARLAGHPGIVGVHDIGEEDGKVFFAMDLVEGASLDRLIDRGELSPRRVAEIVSRAARALHHAHTHGVLHRDVKPGNILVAGIAETTGGDAARFPQERLVVRITDFGLAQTQDSDGADARLTRAGSVLGTPAYLSPEQASGTALDARADVYSLGATLYEALTGEPPFAGDTVYTVLARIQRDEPRPPRQCDPRVPRDLETITLKCIEKDPARRYPTAKDLADDLDRYLENQPIGARPATWGYRLRKRIARHPAAFALGAVAAVVLATLFGFAVRMGLRNVDTNRQLAEEERRKALAEWANLIAGAYYEMSIKTINEMQELEDRFHGVPLPTADAMPPLPGESPDPLQRRLDKVARVAGSLAAKDARYASVRIQDAWRGLAWFYAGHAEGAAMVARAVDEVQQAGSHDPFPAMLLGRLHVAEWLAAITLPPAPERDGRVAPPPVAWSPPAQAAAAAAVEAFRQGADRPVWEKLPHSREYLHLADGVRACTEGRFADAVAVLGQADVETILKAEKAAVRGFAAYHQGDFAAAIDAFSVIIERKREARFGQPSTEDRAWPRVREHRAAAHVALARARQLAQQPDTDDHLGRAIEDLEQAAVRWAAAGRGGDARRAVERALALAGDAGPVVDRLRQLRATLPQ